VRRYLQIDTLKHILKVLYTTSFVKSEDCLPAPVEVVKTKASDLYIHFSTRILLRIGVESFAGKFELLYGKALGIDWPQSLQTVDEGSRQSAVSDLPWYVGPICQ